MFGEFILFSKYIKTSINYKFVYRYFHSWRTFPVNINFPISSCISCIWADETMYNIPIYRRKSERGREVGYYNPRKIQMENQIQSRQILFCCAT